MYPVMEFFAHNPRATAAEALTYFHQELSISEQVAYVKAENAETVRLKGLIHPLYAEKSDINETIKYVLMDIDTAVATKFPPRQGSEKDRERERIKLMGESPQYKQLETQLREKIEEIYQLEQELEAVDRNAKNGRRLIDLYTAYVTFINDFCKSRV